MPSSRIAVIRASLSPVLQTAIEVFEDKYRDASKDVILDFSALKSQFMREKPHADLLELLDPSVRTRVAAALRAYATTQYDREELRRLYGADERFLADSFGEKRLTDKTFLSELRGFFGDESMKKMKVAQKRDLILECASRRLDRVPGYSSQGVPRGTLLCCKDLRKAVAVAAEMMRLQPYMGEKKRGSPIGRIGGGVVPTYRRESSTSIECARGGLGGDLRDEDTTIELPVVYDEAGPLLFSSVSAPPPPILSPTPPPFSPPPPPPTTLPSPPPPTPRSSLPRPARPLPQSSPAVAIPHPVSPLPPASTPSKIPVARKALRRGGDILVSASPSAAMSGAERPTLESQMSDLLALKACIVEAPVPKELKQQMLEPLWAWMKKLEFDDLK